MRTVAAIVMTLGVGGLLRGLPLAAEELVVARESFPYRGTYPLELEHVGAPESGWAMSWQRWGALPPVFVDSHTINNPFGSGHANSERASNHSGQLRASQRTLQEPLGAPGTRVSVAFALMEYVSANQDGACGGVQLLKHGQPVLFCGRALHEARFAVGPSYDAATDSLRPTTLAVARQGELFRTHYLRLVIEYSEPADRATLECYSIYGLPTAAPVECQAADLSCDGIALVLDDYQVDEVIVNCEKAEDKSPIHFRPTRLGRMADTIPFFWNGEYHIFYLRAVGKVPWEHVMSQDLVHWHELPTALWADGDETSADGLNIFTGSVIEHAGTFHLFYVGWNPRNPAGREFIEHAVSRDLTTWQKIPEDQLAPDGVRYSNAPERDFRDPFVWRDAEDGKFWMLLCTGRETGVASSRDLRKWEFDEPLRSAYDGLGTPECPDLFDIGAHTYLITSPIETKSTIARVAANWRSPFADVVGGAIDTPYLYAAKRMWDGRRHVLTGWIRDLENQRDDGAFLWGGTQCVPREVTAGSDPRELRFRPVPEALAEYPHVAVDLVAGSGAVRPDSHWQWMDSARLVGHASQEPARVAIATPANYLMTCTLTPSSDARLTFMIRTRAEVTWETAAERAAVPARSACEGYALSVAENHTELRGQYFRSGREITLPFARQISLTLLVQGTILECFVDDAFAFSCRAYNYRQGDLVLELTRGTVSIDRLSVRTHDQ